MKKTVFAGMLLLSLVFTVKQVFAAPAYGTRMPEKNKFFAGGQTHIVFDRDLEGANGDLKSTQYFVLLSYGLFDWLSIDLKGGIGNIKQDRTAGSEIIYPSFLAGGYGFRIKLFDDGKTRVVTGFQHISVHPYSVDVGGSKHKTVLDDWQVSALVSHDIGKLTPYAGVKLARMDLIYWVDGERNRIKPDDNFGVVIGTDISLTDRIWLNLETQLADAQAYAASVNVKF